MVYKKIKVKFLQIFTCWWREGVELFVDNTETQWFSVVFSLSAVAMAKDLRTLLSEQPEDGLWWYKKLSSSSMFCPSATFELSIESSSLSSKTKYENNCWKKNKQMDHLMYLWTYLSVYHYCHLRHQLVMGKEINGRLLCKLASFSQ